MCVNTTVHSATHFNVCKTLAIMSSSTSYVAVVSSSSSSSSSACLLSQSFSPWHFSSSASCNPHHSRFCSTFCITRDVPSTAVFCSESVECFPGMACRFFFKPFVTISVALIVAFCSCCYQDHNLLLLLLLLHPLYARYVHLLTWNKPRF